MKASVNTDKLDTSRELAKAGMIVSMGAAVYSGFAGARMIRLLHPWAGITMVGFSIWHHYLSTRKK
ncbi:MAG: hypothetical protein D3926_13550 [Desulfobacteraceae bacterium]|nr:MAG: hypothetical protein D3926_13550 [Desulfobacteraceae bacterium]